AGAGGTFNLYEGSVLTFPPTPHRSPDIANFLFSIDGGAETTVNGTVGTLCENSCYLAGTVSHTPSKDMVHTARVKTRDGGRNLSDAVDYQLRVSPLAKQCV